MKPFVNEPLAQFVDQGERDAFKAALDKVRLQFACGYPLVIDGCAYEGKELPIVSVNPSRVGETVGIADSASVGQAALAIGACKAAFPAWAATSVTERAAILRRAAAIVRKDKFVWCAWVLSENGKSWKESDIEVCEFIDFLELYADEAERVMETKVTNLVPGETNYHFNQPKGVCAVISPWNFPLAILGGMAAAALVTGNTVILKPAEQTPVIGFHLYRLFVDAGVPVGAVHYLPGRGEVVGKFLVEHPSVDLIAFTGSKDVGIKINEAAARTGISQQRVKRVICEMGGKNAIIVDEDADLDEAIQGILKSAFNYAGQKCSACSRVICVGSAYEPLKERLAAAVRDLCVAVADEPGCVVSPVIDWASRENIMKYIEIAKSEGAEVIAQVDVSAQMEHGTFAPPTLLDKVLPHHRIAQEEVFGPVVALLRADDFATAVRVATDVEFALTGAVYSRSPANISLAMSEFKVGNLYINRGCTGAYVYRQPFGGFKMSGIGTKAGGSDYLIQFLEQRVVTENTMRRGFAPEAPKSN